MPKFRCEREIIAASGSQEFEVEAVDIDEARELFKSGKGEMVESDCEVTDLADYDLDTLYQES